MSHITDTVPPQYEGEGAGGFRSRGKRFASLSLSLSLLSLSLSLSLSLWCGIMCGVSGKGGAGLTLRGGGTPSQERAGARHAAAPTQGRGGEMRGGGGGRGEMEGWRREIGRAHV